MKQNRPEPWRKREGNQEHLRVPPSTTFFVISSRKIARNSRLLSVCVFGLSVAILKTVKKKKENLNTNGRKKETFDFSFEIFSCDDRDYSSSFKEIYDLNGRTLIFSKAKNFFCVPHGQNLRAWPLLSFRLNRIGRSENMSEESRTQLLHTGSRKHRRIGTLSGSQRNDGFQVSLLVKSRRYFHEPPLWTESLLRQKEREQIRKNVEVVLFFFRISKDIQIYPTRIFTVTYYV